METGPSTSLLSDFFSGERWRFGRKFDLWWRMWLSTFLAYHYFQRVPRKNPSASQTWSSPNPKIFPLFFLSGHSSSCLRICLDSQSARFLQNACLLVALIVLFLLITPTSLDNRHLLHSLFLIFITSKRHIHILRLILKRMTNPLSNAWPRLC